MYTSLDKKGLGGNPLQRQLADSIVKMLPLDDIRILLATGAKANEPVTQGLRPLHYAVWQRYTEAALLILVRGGDINARDECGYSALHLSAEHGYTDLVALLLNEGAQVDFREDTDDPFPRTVVCDEPLRLAIRNRHFAIARMLLENGADPNKRYFFGAEINLVSPLDTDFLRLLLTFGADPNSRDRSGLTPLMKAVRYPQAMESILLLLSHGADVNAMADERNDYRTVLHYAVMSGDHTVINLLLKQGASPNFPPGVNVPCVLDLAIVRGDVDLIQMLLVAGAHVNSSSPVLGTPLHVACSEQIPNKIEILNMLLASGADPNITVDGGDGPPLKPVLSEYLASVENPCPVVVALLIKYGAKVVMKTHYRHPNGLLTCFQHVVQHPRVLYQLLEAAEEFDFYMVKRNQFLTPEQKELLIKLAKTPLTLKHQCRLTIRRLMKTKLIQEFQALPLPRVLQEYLVYS